MRGLVDGDLGVSGVFALGEQCGAAVGLVAGQSDRDQVETGGGQLDSAGASHVQHGPGIGGLAGIVAGAGDHDRGAGVPDVVDGELEQLGEADGGAGRRCFLRIGLLGAVRLVLVALLVALLVEGGVDEDEASSPDVVADLRCAAGDDVHAGLLASVDGGHGVGQSLPGHGAEGVGLVGGVEVDAVAFHGGDLFGDADAVDLDAVRPGVHGQLGGEVADEVAAVGFVAGDGDGGELFAVEKPHVAVVAAADGDEHRVGGGLIGQLLGLGAEVIEVDVGRASPVHAIGGALPRVVQVDGVCQVQDQVVLVAARRRPGRASGRWSAACRPARRRSA